MISPFRYQPALLSPLAKGDNFHEWHKNYNLSASFLQWSPETKLKNSSLYLDQNLRAWKDANVFESWSDFIMKLEEVVTNPHPDYYPDSFGPSQAQVPQETGTPKDLQQRAQTEMTQGPEVIRDPANKAEEAAGDVAQRCADPSAEEEIHTPKDSAQESAPKDEQDNAIKDSAQDGAAQIPGGSEKEKEEIAQTSEGGQSKDKKDSVEQKTPVPTLDNPVVCLPIIEWKPVPMNYERQPRNPWEADVRLKIGHLNDEAFINRYNLWEPTISYENSTPSRMEVTATEAYTRTVFNRTSVKQLQQEVRQQQNQFERYRESQSENITAITRELSTLQKQVAYLDQANFKLHRQFDTWKEATRFRPVQKDERRWKPSRGSKGKEDKDSGRKTRDADPKQSRQSHKNGTEHLTNQSTKVKAPEKPFRKLSLQEKVSQPNISVLNSSRHDERAWYTKVKINGKSLTGLIDTGSNVCALKKCALQWIPGAKIEELSEFQITAFAGHPIKIYGKVILDLQLAEEPPMKTTFYLINELHHPTSVIISGATLSKYEHYTTQDAKSTKLFIRTPAEDNPQKKWMRVFRIPKDNFNQEDLEESEDDGFQEPEEVKENFPDYSSRPQSNTASNSVSPKSLLPLMLLALITICTTRGEARSMNFPTIKSFNQSLIHIQNNPKLFNLPFPIYEKVLYNSKDPYTFIAKSKSPNPRIPSGRITVTIPTPTKNTSFINMIMSTTPNPPLRTASSSASTRNKKVKTITEWTISQFIIVTSQQKPKNLQQNSTHVLNITNTSDALIFVQTKATSPKKNGRPNIISTRLFNITSPKAFRQLRKLQTRTNLNQSSMLPNRTVTSLTKYLINPEVTTELNMSSTRIKREASTEAPPSNATKLPTAILNSTTTRHQRPVNQVNSVEVLSLLLILVIIFILVIKKSTRKSNLAHAIPLLAQGSTMKAQAFQFPNLPGMYVKELTHVHPYEETLPLVLLQSHTPKAPSPISLRCKKETPECQYAKALSHITNPIYDELIGRYQSLFSSPWSEDITEVNPESPYSDLSYEEIHKYAALQEQRMSEELRPFLRRHITKPDHLDSHKLVSKARTQGLIVSENVKNDTLNHVLFQDYKSKVNQVNYFTAYLDIQARENIKISCAHKLLSTQFIATHELQNILRHIEPDLINSGRKLLIPHHHVNTYYTQKLTFCAWSPEITLVHLEIPIIPTDYIPRLFEVKPLSMAHINLICKLENLPKHVMTTSEGKLQPIHRPAGRFPAITPADYDHEADENCINAIIEENTSMARYCSLQCYPRIPGKPKVQLLNHGTYSITNNNQHTIIRCGNKTSHIPAMNVGTTIVNIPRGCELHVNDSIYTSSNPALSPNTTDQLYKYELLIPSIHDYDLAASPNQRRKRSVEKQEEFKPPQVQILNVPSQSPMLTIINIVALAMNSAALLFFTKFRQLEKQLRDQQATNQAPTNVRILMPQPTTIIMSKPNDKKPTSKNLSEATSSAASSSNDQLSKTI